MLSDSLKVNIYPILGFKESGSMLSDSLKVTQCQFLGFKESRSILRDSLKVTKYYFFMLERELLNVERLYKK